MQPQGQGHTKWVFELRIQPKGEMKTGSLGCFLGCGRGLSDLHFKIREHEGGETLNHPERTVGTPQGTEDPPRGCFLHEMEDGGEKSTTLSQQEDNFMGLDTKYKKTNKQTYS